jgi:hypothetical protein
MISRLGRIFKVQNPNPDHMVSRWAEQGPPPCPLYASESTSLQAHCKRGIGVAMTGLPICHLATAPTSFSTVSDRDFRLSRAIPWCERAAMDCPSSGCKFT